MTTATQRQIASASRGFVETQGIPAPCSLISLHNPDCEPARVFNPDAAVRRLNLAFHDLDGPAPPLVMPTIEQAEQCLEFARGDDTGLIVCQCDAGCGRSQGTQAALLRLFGSADLADHVLAAGTYNRPWYRLLLGVAGIPVPAEPLVSVVVRVKYPIDRSEALLHSLRRQRWDNWEMVLVFDGDEGKISLRWSHLAHQPKVRVIHTPECKGRWGHPYRQLGIDKATGEYVCLANDDNYYVPGFIEQMVGALERERADLVLCDMLHRYQGWQYTRSFIDEQSISTDVAAWMARADLVKSTPWPGNDFTSDAEYVAALAATAGTVAHLKRALVIKN